MIANAAPNSRWMSTEMALTTGGMITVAAARSLSSIASLRKLHGDSWIGHCNPCPRLVFTSCRLRHKNLRKRLQAEKSARERLAVDAEDFPSEEARDEGSEGEKNVQMLANGPFFPSKDSKTEESLDVEEKRSFSVSIEDLLLMIREAEKNILLLNQVRARALKDLQESRREKDSLRAEVEVLRTRLAESSAKIKLAEQEKLKNEMLQDEVQILQKKLKEKEDSQQQALTTKSSSIKGTKFEEEVESLKSSLADLRSKDELLKQLRTDKTELQDRLQSLESRLEENTVSLTDLENAKAENDTLKENIRKLQMELQVAELSATEAFKLSEQKLSPTTTGSEAVGSTNDRLLLENRMLQEQVKKLLVQLAQAESQKILLEHAQADKKALKEQVQLLQHRLLESDAEIRTQLQTYQAEVEGFQARLERLKSEKKSGILQVPAGEMPWDFWTGIHLRIDAWMLDKVITVEDGEELRLMAWRRDARLRDAFVQLQEKSNEEIMSGLLKLVNDRKRPGLYVVHIAAEMAPVAKVGGLGDVVTGLSRSLQRKDHLVEIILPKYDCMDYDRIKNLKVLDMELLSFFDNQTFKNKVWLGTVEGLPVYFIEPFHPANFFTRRTVYGERDDFRRFTYFCRAALEFLLQSNKRPDIIHSHDWTSAAVAPLYWDIYVPLGLNSARLAFTCHNFEYQGTESPAALAAFGLNVQQQFRQDRMQDSFMHDRVNLLKGGIVFSNIVTTVSPTYAQEVRAPEAGRGLQVALSVHSNKFYGILNGIDVEAWDPSYDPILQHQYSAEDLSGKAANKASLQSQLRLNVDKKRPLIGCITRLVPQKGVHLIRHAIYHTAEKGGQFVLLGSSPVPEIQREFEELSYKFEGHSDVRLLLKYDEPLAHSIYAASDIFVIPSVFEPCGLTQMIAMRYGSIPVVRRTGGLNDSVFDVDDTTIPEEKRNGFSFSAAEIQGLNYALDRAIKYYLEKPGWWQQLVKKTMRLDFSWDSSADQYIELYRQAINRARSRAPA
ncbi:probable starch synthase 4, chloroplastic/amyloplastic isoform X1 [Selaginella moellendorffii]|uniref:probable starch synthase 4, chloroplastic/amyloplastic isoform X1 n=1 Tax=Selaginella moellendorffii TaxID=88036 RepID=UPI000D1D0418|nr:probable starch synthase 4, chloroplastic/amyloplastic isoform X1 [Selaginella moellendorffii]|eukprot:XP_024531361.1 probable starch synthase 4, chloroplastic/amyloplastic isoform X1 [Selaginella moellendorffii]